VSARACVCGDRDPGESHDRGRCERRDVSRRVVVSKAEKNGIPAATAIDLWAHLRTPRDDGTDAAFDAAAVIDLGWRPVVGNNLDRLWKRSSS
jgi:hypothetical protein